MGGGVGHSFHYATETESSQPDKHDGVEPLEKCDEDVETPWPLGREHTDEAIAAAEDDIDSDIDTADSSDDKEALYDSDDIGNGYESP